MRMIVTAAAGMAIAAMLCTSAFAQACPKGYRKNSKGNCCKIATDYRSCVASCTQCGGSDCPRFCAGAFKK